MKLVQTEFTRLIDCDTRPWSRYRQSPYNDLILLPEFRRLRLEIPIGCSSIRVAPALMGSTKGFMLGVHTLFYKRGRHAHVRTLDSDGTSVFDLAHNWMQVNQPESLFSKINRRGYKLVARPMYMCWVIVNQRSNKGSYMKAMPRLAVLDGYDASDAGGTGGVGRQLWHRISRWDACSEGIASPLHRVEGPRIDIERIQAKGDKYPRYEIRPGRVPAPMDDELDRMNADDLDALRPLEEVIHIPNAEEEWILLESVLPEALIRRIRASLH